MYVCECRAVKLWPLMLEAAFCFLKSQAVEQTSQTPPRQVPSEVPRGFLLVVEQKCITVYKWGSSYKPKKELRRRGGGDSVHSWILKKKTKKCIYIYIYTEYFHMHK